MLWILWLIAAAAFGVAEFFTLTLAFGLLAAAALVAAVVAGLGGPLLLQVLAFAITAAVGLLIVRPTARRHMAHRPLVREGSDALIGNKAVVVQEVTADRGLIRLGGEVWSARAYDEYQTIPMGALVDVMEIEGATAIVYPRERLP
jgi:membrane protein implicated in regulation of membrane protease activity